ncbi:mitochondrial ribosomal protein L10 isoform X2 [Lycorma delicatula]|uniref:mitochondrial ribosomal protein L10 isoform X1 n=1 Tax=Lycorma delicatula TaxID=130591 RepID=UPI003F514404
MGSIGKGVLYGKTWQPLLQSVRYNRRVNIQKPRPPHYIRARLEMLAKPIFPEPIEKLLPLSAKCKLKEEEEIRNFRIDNPYENLLAKELLQLYNDSRLIAICQKNPMIAEDQFNMIIRFKRNKMVIKYDGKHTTKLALKGTKFEPVLDLFTVHQCAIFCKEPNVKALLTNLKKTPQLILLAAIVDGYYANVNQIKEYARLEDISHARAQLVSVLNSAAQSIVSGLNHHQTALVSGLDQYLNLKEGDSNISESKEKENEPQSSSANTSETSTT